MSEQELKELVLGELGAKNELKLKKLKKKMLAKLQDIRPNDDKEVLEVVLRTCLLTHSLAYLHYRLLTHSLIVQLFIHYPHHLITHSSISIMTDLLTVAGGV